MYKVFGLIIPWTLLILIAKFLLMIVKHSKSVKTSHEHT